jgi:hypothetical protein
MISITEPLCVPVGFGFTALTGGDVLVAGGADTADLMRLATNALRRSQNSGTIGTANPEGTSLRRSGLTIAVMRGRTGTDISDGLVARAVGAFVASVDLPAR